MTMAPVWMVWILLPVSVYLDSLGNFVMSTLMSVYLMPVRIMPPAQMEWTVTLVFVMLDSLEHSVNAL